MDPLEDVLSLLEVTSHLSTSLIAGGRWAIRFDPPAGVKFNSVRKGRCVLNVDGVEDAVLLGEGDCFLLTEPRAFTLASDFGVDPIPAHPIFATAVDGVARTGVGDDLLAVGGRFSFGDHARALLLDGLPPIIHIPVDTFEAETIRWSLDQIATEVRTRPVASTLVAEHLALVMLIHVLRLHLSHDPTCGWLAGLADPVVAPALKAMHARPAHPWTVEELAYTGAVSRSTFAARFKAMVGRGPLDYLTDWRIEMTSHRLRSGTDTLAAIAAAVGYSSESALSTAFKRVTGLSPRVYREQTSSS